MSDDTHDAIHEARVEIQAYRNNNNAYFMDWWEATMKCPHCGPVARRYQSLIRRGDAQITARTAKLCE